MAHVVSSKEEVREILIQAVNSGGTLIKDAQDVFWGSNFRLEKCIKIYRNKLHHLHILLDKSIRYVREYFHIIPIIPRNNENAAIFVHKKMVLFLFIQKTAASFTQHPGKSPTARIQVQQASANGL